MILVTGGAGYIGSHVVQQLTERGERVLVLDNLISGFRSAVQNADLVIGDIADAALLQQLFQQHPISAIIHFAAHTVVPESVSDPLKYYANNTCATRNLLSCASAADIPHFLFSSTAAVYGNPSCGVVDEDSALQPINPYGNSKLMSEMMLRDLSLATPMRHVILRYFNVAGSDPQGRIGQSTVDATLLIKVACEHALGKRAQLTLFGTDYPTADGTCVRDYIHVADLAAAHLKALDHLRDGGASVTLNCGYGHGYSVRQVLASVASACGHALDIVEEARRPGDPASLVANSDRLKQLLDWQPQYDDLDFIVRTALDWEARI